MDCSEFSEYFYRFLDNELGDEKLKQEMSAHLKACPICALGLEKETKFDKLIRGHLFKERAHYELKEAVVMGVEKSVTWGGFSELIRFFRPAPAVGALALFMTIIVIAALTTVSQPFPVFAESIHHHVGYLNGQYPTEIQSQDINEVLAWFEGKLDFDVTRPHVDVKQATLLGARVCRLHGKPVAIFMFEKDGKEISAYVIDYDHLALPHVSKEKMIDGKNNRVYVNSEDGYSSAFCYHKRTKTGCIVVSEMSEQELMGLMG